MIPHPTISAFGVTDGQLRGRRRPVERLAERVGSTPFFAYDRQLLTSRVALLRSTLPDAIELSYAVKANPMPAVVQHLSALVDSFDVASALEMRTALDTTTPPERISFAGPGKSTAELSQAVAAGVTIELESPTEAMRAVEAGERLGRRPRVAIRVNPDFRVKGSGMRMGGGSQQFGVDAEQVPSLLADLGRADVELLGFHVFAGSQNLDAAVLADAQRRTVDLVLELAEAAPGPIRYLNLGGGFGIPYFERDLPLDLEAVGENLWRLHDELIRPNLPDARVVVELGRYIVGECGDLRHQSRGQEGVARSHVPRSRRWSAPPTGRVRQLRAGDQAQLPRRGRQPSAPRRGRPGDRRRVPLYAARPSRRRCHTATGRDRRPGRAFPSWCVRADSESDGLSRASGTGRGARVA